MFDSVSVSRLTLLPSSRVGSRERATDAVTAPEPSATASASEVSNETRPARKPGVLDVGDVAGDDALAHREAVEGAVHRHEEVQLVEHRSVPLPVEVRRPVHGLEVSDPCSGCPSAQATGV